MFACIGSETPGVSVKTDSIDTAQGLIEEGLGDKAPYFHRSWVLLPWDSEVEFLEERLRESYRIVRSGLTKKVQATLDPLD